MLMSLKNQISLPALFIVVIFQVFFNCILWAFLNKNKTKIFKYIFVCIIYATPNYETIFKINDTSLLSFLFKHCGNHKKLHREHLIGCQGAKLFLLLSLLLLSQYYCINFFFLVLSNLIFFFVTVSVFELSQIEFFSLVTV